MTGIAGRHWRAVIGLCLMAVGIIGAAVALIFQVRAVAPAPVTWLFLMQQYGFPALLVVGGYHLYQRHALADIAEAWKARKL